MRKHYEDVAKTIMYIIKDPSILTAFFTALHGQHQPARQEQLQPLLGWGLLVLISFLLFGIGIIQWLLWNEPTAWQLVVMMLATAAVGLAFLLHTRQQRLEFTATAIVHLSPFPFESWSIPYTSITAIGLEQHRQTITRLYIATNSQRSRTIPCFVTMQSICARYVGLAQAL